MEHYIQIDIRSLYDSFDASIAALDCGQKCAPHNPSGKPFCCDICHAVPAVHQQEWEYLRLNTDLWHIWRGDECPDNPEDPAHLQSETPDSMILLACQGPSACQRPYRALSCRQFPFYPYITSSFRFIGLAYDAQFEQTCWVISHLEVVSQTYRQEFMRAYDRLFEQWPEEFNSYLLLSQELRDHYAAQKHRLLLLHRNGTFYKISPSSERMERVMPEQLPRFGPYRV
jgi:hypothetical protein